MLGVFVGEDWIILPSWDTIFRYNHKPLSKRIRTCRSLSISIPSDMGGKKWLKIGILTFVMRIRYFSTRWSLLWHPASNCHTSPLRASGTPLLTSADNVFGLTLKLRCLGVGEGRVTITQIQINKYKSNNWCGTSNMSTGRNFKTVRMLPE